MSEQQVLTFTVYGRPQARGSKTPWVLRRKDGSLVLKNGRPVINTADSNKKSGPWMAAVAAAAGEAMLKFNGGSLMTGQIGLSVRFYFARPKAHYGTGRNADKLKHSAPKRWFGQSPDQSKIVRGLEDGMSGVVYLDDKQVAHYSDIVSLWTEQADRSEVCVWELADG